MFLHRIVSRRCTIPFKVFNFSTYLEEGRKDDIRDQRKERIAILIDSDNSEGRLAPEFIKEASRFGRVTVKRAYGDFTQQQLRGWIETANRFVPAYIDQTQTHSIR